MSFAVNQREQDQQYDHVDHFRISPKYASEPTRPPSRRRLSHTIAARTYDCEKIRPRAPFALVMEKEWS